MRDEDWMPDTAEIWAIALTDLKITGSELKTAQRKSMSLEWPPTAPSDFLALGRTDMSGEYPETRKAYEHAVDYSGRLFDDRNDWRHVVIYETARRIGFTKLAINPERLTWVLWRDVYNKVCADHKAGVEMNLPIDKSRQLENVHTPVSADNEAVNDFIKKYGSKRGKSS